MSNHRNFCLKQGARVILVLVALVSALAFAPPASAGVHVSFGFNLVLPPGVYVSGGNYDPYYVGQVFYAPAGVWRPVYSFPVATAYGVVYRPYVYDGGHPVCNGYIPGPSYGYSAIRINGHGHYDPHWYHGPHGNAGHHHDGHSERGRDRHDDDWHHARH